MVNSLTFFLTSNFINNRKEVQKVFNPQTEKSTRDTCPAKNTHPTSRIKIKERV